MKKRYLVAVGVIVAIPLLAVAWWLGSPLFREDTVSEDIPDNIRVVSNDEIVANVSATNAAEAIPTTAPTNDAVAIVDDADPTAIPTSVPPTVPPSDDVTAIEIKRGRFRNADSFHQGSGDAILFQLSDGRHLLRFENFSVTNGPDLQVYLVPRRNDDNVTVDGYIDLGQLKGNVGNQNYFIEADVAIPTEASIVIWCEPFSVLFSVATLN